MVILVVDDEPDLRELVAAILEDGGHTVLTAADGEEGLRILSQHWVDIMLTDIRMPRLNGIDLAEQARALRPSLQVIFTSGGDYHLPVSPMLRKPFRTPELFAAIGGFQMAPGGG